MNRLKRIRNARVEQHLAIVEPVARHYAASSGRTQEDLRQVGLLGLLRAAERLNQEGRCRLQHLPTPYPRSDPALPQRWCRPGAHSSSGPGDSNPGSGGMNAAKQRRSMSDDLEHVQAIEPVRTRPESLECSRAVLTALAELNRSDRQAVTHVVLKGQSLRQAGRCIGVSAMTVQRRLKRGLNSLRHELRTQPWPD